MVWQVASPPHLEKETWQWTLCLFLGGVLTENQKEQTTTILVPPPHKKKDTLRWGSILSWHLGVSSLGDLPKTMVFLLASLKGHQNTGTPHKTRPFGLSVAP